MSVLMRATRQSLQDAMAEAKLQAHGASPWEASLKAALEVLTGREGALADAEVVLLAALVQGGAVPLREGGALDVLPLTPAMARACGIFESDPSTTRELVGALQLVKMDRAQLLETAASRALPARLRGKLADLADGRCDLAALGRALASELGRVQSCRGRKRRERASASSGLAELALELEKDIMAIVDMLDGVVDG